MDSTNKSKYSSFGLSSLYGFFTVPVNYLFPKDKPSKTNAKSQAASNYAKLCIEVRQDLKSIMENIDRFNAELCGYVEKNKTTNKEHEGLQIKLERYSVFKESNINVERTKEGIETEVILNELQHLRIGYPEYNLGASPTTQEIQDAYKELEEHHQKTVNLALTLFPRLDGILNYTRNDTNKSEREACNLGARVN